MAWQIVEGGCLCGAIRYRVSGEPVMSLMCFCTACRATAGTDGYAGMMVRYEDFAHLSGTPATYARGSESGRQVVRHFCPECGANLWGATELGLVSVAAGTLDGPGPLHSDEGRVRRRSPEVGADSSRARAG